MIKSIHIKFSAHNKECAEEFMLEYANAFKGVDYTFELSYHGRTEASHSQGCLSRMNAARKENEEKRKQDTECTCNTKRRAYDHDMGCPKYISALSGHITL